MPPYLLEINMTEKEAVEEAIRIVRCVHSSHLQKLLGLASLVDDEGYVDTWRHFKDSYNNG